jgi:hypothetical protein
VREILIENKNGYAPGLGTLPDPERNYKIAVDSLEIFYGLNSDTLVIRHKEGIEMRDRDTKLTV